MNDALCTCGHPTPHYPVDHTDPSVARLHAERDRARDLAVHAMSLVDWSTPSWRVNPDDPAGEIALRGFAIFEPERNPR